MQNLQLLEIPVEPAGPEGPLQVLELQLLKGVDVWLQSLTPFEVKVEVFCEQVDYSPGSATTKSMWFLSLVLKASAMILAASLCWRPLRETPLTSRIT